MCPSSLSTTCSKRLWKFQVTNEKMPGSSRSELKISIFFRRAEIVVGLFAQHSFFRLKRAAIPHVFGLRHEFPGCQGLVPSVGPLDSSFRANSHFGHNMAFQSSCSSSFQGVVGGGRQECENASGQGHSQSCVFTVRTFVITCPDRGVHEFASPGALVFGFRMLWSPYPHPFFGRATAVCISHPESCRVRFHPGSLA